MELKPNAEAEQKIQITEDSSSPTDKSDRFLGINFSNILNVLPPASLLIITISFADSAWKARRDPGMLAFVLLSYADLVALFWCLDKLEKLGRDGEPEKRKRLKVAAWILANALNVAFTWLVAEIMTPVLAVIIWFLSGFFAAASFYALFLLRDLQCPAAGDGPQFGLKNSGSKV